ncbi:MAG: glycosyltransferase family 87 protein [Acidobacteriota bacterium]
MDQRKKLISEKTLKKVGVVILWLIALIAVLRLLTLSAEFCHSSLQQDLSAFYTAGESLNHGLDPYRNHLSHNPPVWDGIDIFRHSRFLYPPLVATFFQPVALLPYRLVKYLWAAATVVLLAGSMMLVVKIITTAGRADTRYTSRKEESADEKSGNFVPHWMIPAIIIFVAFFYPLLTHLERGQIDMLTLFLILMTIRNLMSGREWRAGGILALTTLFKLHSIYAVFFLLIRKHWKMLGGYILGAMFLISLSIVLNGSLFYDYLLKEFPRIALYGERGTPGDLLLNSLLPVSFPCFRTTRRQRMVRPIPRSLSSSSRTQAWCVSWRHYSAYRRAQDRFLPLSSYLSS